MTEFEEMNEKLAGLDGNYNPVTVTLTETTGLVAVSTIALILLFALLRSQSRVRDLQRQLYQEEEAEE